MTIVVIKDGIMCSDSLITQGSAKLGAVKKIFRLPQYIIGVAGTYQHAVLALDWFKAGKPEQRPNFETDKPDFALLVYEKNTGTIVYYQDSFLGDIITSNIHAIGSGADLAIGAMEAGATAREAVKIAIKRSTTCGGRIQSVKLR